MKLVPFNINDSVRVRLTVDGHKALRINYRELYRGTNWERLNPYRSPKEDADGWSRWQLWCLMQELGPHTHMGGRPLIVGNQIELEVED